MSEKLNNQSYFRKLKETISLDTKVDVTDPCYRKGVWCRHTLSCVPGEYNCSFNVHVSYTSFGEGRRISRCRIVRKNDPDAKHGIRNRLWKPVASIGVDAGMAGFFANKPDFETDAEWNDFCSKLSRATDNAPSFRGNIEEKGVYVACHANATEFVNKTEGFWTDSGYGDGHYDVFALQNQEGENVAFEIRFI